jgi:hypothetical protein
MLSSKFVETWTTSHENVDVEGILRGEFHRLGSSSICFGAIFFGTINIVGGFLVTDRMLEMFKSKPARREKGDDGGGDA